MKATSAGPRNGSTGSASASKVTTPSASSASPGEGTNRLANAMLSPNAISASAIITFCSPTSRRGSSRAIPLKGRTRPSRTAATCPRFCGATSRSVASDSTATTMITTSRNRPSR